MEKISIVILSLLLLLSSLTACTERPAADSTPEPTAAPKQEDTVEPVNTPGSTVPPVTAEPATVEPTETPVPAIMERAWEFFDRINQVHGLAISKDSMRVWSSYSGYPSEICAGCEELNCAVLVSFIKENDEFVISTAQLLSEEVITDYDELRAFTKITITVMGKEIWNKICIPSEIEKRIILPLSIW